MEEVKLPLRYQIYLEEKLKKLYRDEAKINYVKKNKLTYSSKRNKHKIKTAVLRRNNMYKYMEEYANEKLENSFFNRQMCQRMKKSFPVKDGQIMRFRRYSSPVQNPPKVTTDK